MINKYFIWPESKIANALSSCWKIISTEQVENKLFKMFPSGYPVLCSSGRSALALAIEVSNKTRGDLVGLFPYASHCVIEAVSRTTTPLLGPTAIQADLRIVYHQWGYVQEKKLPLNTIEDCVDTLCVPGTKLFPGGGSFEIWSLPKILGTTSGGILWCKNQEKALQIKELRDSRGSSFFQWILRLLSKKCSLVYNYWQGAESVTGRPSILQTGEIMYAISKWNNIVQDRKKNLDLVWSLALKGLLKPVQRLPTVVPVESQIEETTLHMLGISSGYRMFEIVNEDGSRKMIKVLPLPVFQDVGTNWLLDIHSKLVSKSDSSNA